MFLECPGAFAESKVFFSGCSMTLMQRFFASRKSSLNLKNRKYKNSVPENIANGTVGFLKQNLRVSLA
jgi:hypothetical protein